MEQKDLELIRELVDSDQELAELWRRHLELETQLENMNQRVYLTSEEQVERKRLQKIKLAGRDRMDAILATYRQQGRQA
ncbi:MAG: DUF465 domain-containing protein [Desulfarculus sp.]|nr:DUF465 domain-containing protein [Desulfarculus sp.]MBI5524000.1 DUF465 domain-containing protein [Desulfarculus sp.]